MWAPEAVKKSRLDLGVGWRGFAACCAESLWLSGKRPNLKTLLFFLFPGPERPSLSAQQGKAAISSQLPTARVLERYREYREGRRTAV